MLVLTTVKPTSEKFISLYISLAFNHLKYKSHVPCFSPAAHISE